MGFTWNIGFYIVYLYFTLSTVRAVDVCTPLSSCSCEYPNGTGIDLTPAEKSTFYSAETFKVNETGSPIELFTYYYHPCYDTPMPLNSTVNSTCIGPLSICRHVTILTRNNASSQLYTMIGGSYDFMGKTEVSQFTPDGGSIKYANGPSSTIVLLVCAQTDDSLHIISLDDPANIVLSFNSRSACLKQIDTGRSLGSTLLIVFFSCLIFYLVLGICTKKFLMGATGIEVVPNLAFWSDLPNLVKDGWAFMINGFKLPARATNGAVRTPDPNSYDSI